MKKILKGFFKFFLVPLMALLLLALLSLELYRTSLQSEEWQKNKISVSTGIESLERVKLGGLDQWIYIRGVDQSKPVLLFLHGGPGSPEMPMATKKFQGELEQEFVIVHWDQRGAGKSYSNSITAADLKFEKYLEDIKQLTEILLKRFHKPRLFLLGHSWGSLIGIEAAFRYPQYYYAYIGVGQIADMPEGERLSYRFAVDTARSRKNEEALRELEEIGSPPFDNLRAQMTERKWVNKFGGAIYGEPNPIALIGRIYFTFPEYTFLDLVYRIPMGTYTSLTGLSDQMLKAKPIQTISHLKIPLYIMCGRHDYTVPAPLTEKFYHKIKAPRKRLYWFEKSAHSPNFEEPHQFARIMIDQVLKESLRK